MEYITGWVTVLGLIVTGSLVVMNMVNPFQGERRLKVHSIMGTLTLVAIIAHLLIIPFEGFNDIPIWFTAVLILVTVLTGFMLRYLPGLGMIRYYIRAVHPVIIVAIIISVIRHVLVTLDILQVVKLLA